MSRVDGQIHVLLPALPENDSCAALRRMCVLGDRLADAPPGYLPALQTLFQWPGKRLPSAALTREAACGDAGESTWLSADPAYVEPDVNGARMLACGQLDLDAEDAQTLARGLRPLFGDHGMALELSEPMRWHLRLADGAMVPEFDSVEQVLGEDLLAHLPTGEQARRWRRLFNEAQMVLHQHPLNAARRKRGQMPVNCLWFWGGGKLPAWVKSRVTRVFSSDPLTRALAARAAVDGTLASPDALAGLPPSASVLLDIDGADSLPAWDAALDALWRKRRHAWHLYFADGKRFHIVPGHRWRVWRRPRS